ncbi:L-threonylcarbamoyladenylate synthase [Pseudalkalibacillus caeni]|uniref:Threonylcarbamoyl-AMP synthase n=1 Tax=Exobacillus caeni TaxID=2574798 RepID=A0A5R9F161_9BACL|nr:L-threonylcarbamoyladenylate synthase [Pseudalkalibacillus caeni]TLS36741.1 threonylcarbamoyl-AMP synthase [Pseudalkalibacillus caeni]
MHTNVWVVDENVDNLESCAQITESAELLQKNEVVAFPTETVYGLGGNALSEIAIAKIFKAKGRPADNPLIVHVSSVSQLDQLVKHIPESARPLIEAFWPGPLTIVMPGGAQVASNVTAGLDTVAIRMPDHPVARALIHKSGIPLAAPSANLSGKPSPTTAAHVYEDLKGRIAGVVDGGPTGVGVESTVVDCTGDVVTILRPGGITREQLEEVVGKVSVDPALSNEGQAPKSPGVKYKHYAPQAPFTLVEGDTEAIQSLVNEAKTEGKKVGVLATEESKHHYDADLVISCGTRKDLATVANRLYDVLRAFDKENVDVIYGETFPTSGMGEAVMNRLMKAANGRIIKKEFLGN